ncbi:MAG: hypothetical protein FJ291_13725 [Planctomycetes bacterium]|nr:hypothetical protein [Planctomycetota bacterium]
MTTIEAESYVDDLLRRAESGDGEAAAELDEIAQSAYARWAATGELPAKLDGLGRACAEARFRAEGGPGGALGQAWRAAGCYFGAEALAAEGAPKKAVRRWRGEARRAAMFARRSQDPEARALAEAVLKALSR